MTSCSSVYLSRLISLTIFKCLHLWSCEPLFDPN